MKKRQKKKLNKNKEIVFTFKSGLSKQMEEDGIAYLIKNYYNKIILKDSN